MFLKNTPIIFENSNGLLNERKKTIILWSLYIISDQVCYKVYFLFIFPSYILYWDYSQNQNLEYF